MPHVLRAVVLVAVLVHAGTARGQGACIPKDRFTPAQQKLIQQCADKRGPLSDFANIEAPSAAQHRAAYLQPGRKDGALLVPVRLRANKAATVKLGWYSAGALCQHLDPSELTHTFNPRVLNAWQSHVLKLPTGLRSIPPVARPTTNKVAGCLVLQLSDEAHAGKLRTKPYSLDVRALSLRVKAVVRKVKNKRKGSAPLLTRKVRRRAMAKLTPKTLRWLEQVDKLTITALGGPRLQGHGARDLSVYVKGKHLWVKAPSLKKKGKRANPAQKKARGTIRLQVGDAGGWVRLTPALPLRVQITGPAPIWPYVLAGAILLLIVGCVVLRRRMYPPVARKMCLKNMESGLLEEELFCDVSGRLSQPEHHVPLHKLGLDGAGNMVLRIQRDGAILATLPDGVELIMGGQTKTGTFPAGAVDTTTGRLRSPRGLGRLDDQSDKPRVLLQNME